MSWRDDVRRANETLDWIEQRQGPLKPTSYARIETTVGQVKAMAEGQDDARVQEIRGIHVVGGGKRSDSCAHCYTQWPCETAYLLARMDALTAERDLLRVERDIARRVEQESSAAAYAWQAEAVKVQAERDVLRARAERAEERAAALAMKVEGQDYLLRAYRLGTRPPEKAFTLLRKAEAALAAASEGE